MNRKFGSFFRYAGINWYKPISHKWKEESIWSFVVAIPSYLVMYFWIGIDEIRIEFLVALSIISGTVITQIFRFLYLLLDAPFSILKEQDILISSLENVADKKSVIARLSQLWTDGTNLRNKGEALMHESRIAPWWEEHLAWRNETKSIISLIDPTKASQWWTLGMYSPRRRIQYALSPFHEKKIQMFDAWLEKLELLIDEFRKGTN